MGMESDVSIAAFDAFAIAATLEGVDVTVVIDRDVEVMSDSEVRHVGCMVTGKKSVFSGWARGNLVDCAEGKFRLQELVADDGYILEIEALPTPSA